MQKSSNHNVIAIYSRKSRFTGKGESIGNQVELCRSYIRTTFGDEYAEKPSSTRMKDFQAAI